MRIGLAIVLLAVCASGLLANQIPIADAGPDQDMYLGDILTLHGSASDPDGHPVDEWQWDVISAPAGSTPTLYDAYTSDPTFTSDTLGVYVLTLIVSDRFDWSDPDATLITIAPNQAPTAVASALPLSGPAPLLVDFDGTASTDPEGGPLVYNWDFGDSSSGTGATTTHTYDYPGYYQGYLVVTDDHGNSDFDVFYIDVVPEPGTLILLAAGGLALLRRRGR